MWYEFPFSEWYDLQFNNERHKRGEDLIRRHLITLFALWASDNFLIMNLYERPYLLCHAINAKP